MDIELIEQKPESVSIIEKAKQSEAAGGGAFMNPEPKKAKGKPGRPKGSASKTDSDKKSSTQDIKSDESKKDSGPMIETKALCYPIVKGISAMGVNYCRDPRAAMTAPEIEGMAEGLGLVLDKYMPDAMKNYGPEMVLAFSLGQYGLRLYAIKKLQEDHAKRTNPGLAPETPRPESGFVQNNIETEPASVVP